MLTEFAALDESGLCACPIICHGRARRCLRRRHAWNSIVGPVGDHRQPCSRSFSGVSLFALQFAKAMGARSSSRLEPGEGRTAQGARADVVVDYARSDGAGVRAATGGRGADLVVETMVGHDRTIDACGKLHGQICC